MDYYLEGKTGLITGAGSGIGKATAQKLHSLGATLVLCDINLESLKQLQTQFEKRPSPVRHIYTQLDVGDSGQCISSIQSLQMDADGHCLDFLFNCAGINPIHMPLTETTDAYFSRIVDVNLRGTFNMSRACVPVLRRGSVIVNVSSMCGLRGYPGFSIYCATKFAIVGFTKALAIELGALEIRVNAVAPGPIDTPTMAGNTQGGDKNKQLSDSLALGRLGESSEVADVVTFLLSSQSTFMTGSVVEVTGGLR